MKKIKCIMLVDDNPDDILFHERAIEKSGAAEMVISMDSALDALEYLLVNDPTNIQPDLIFIDLNMPMMSGWEFLEKYSGIDRISHCPVIIMSAADPDLPKSADGINVSFEFRIKPLTKEILDETINRYFP